MKNTDLSEDTKAILLLCCPLVPKGSFRPLSLTEYNNLAKVLYEKGLRPSSVLEETDLKSLASWAQITDSHRLEGLLAMRGKLGFFLEEWQQAGIWIVSRADSCYPKNLKEHLGHQRPPLLFGIGNVSILEKGGLGIVGSRNVDLAGENFTRKVAKLCAEEKIPVVSGGARGVDSIAMLGVAQEGGCAVGFLADSLIKKSLSSDFRDYIANDQIVILSPYHPKAGFNVGAAMGRNKLIYAQADSTLIISSDFQKGGTWAGATEELKRPRHRAVLVRDEEGVPLGNKEIIKLGGISYPPITDQADFKLRLMKSVENTQESNSKDIKNEKSCNRIVQCSLLSEKVSSPQSTKEIDKNDEMPSSDAIFKAVVPIICKSLCIPATAKELAERFDVAIGQMQKWLNRALAENILKKEKNYYHLINSE